MSGRFFLWLIGGFAALILGANATMAVFAFTSWRGLDAEEPYIQGLNYNDELARRADQAALGWRLGVETEAIGPDRLHVRVVPVDAADRLLADATIEGTLVRPTQEGTDVAFRLAPAGPRYVADVAVPLPGVWDLHLTVRRGHQMLRHQTRVVLAP